MDLYQSLFLKKLFSFFNEDSQFTIRSFSSFFSSRKEALPSKKLYMMNGADTKENIGSEIV